MPDVQTLGKENVPIRPRPTSALRERLRFTDYLPFILILSLLIPYRIYVGTVLLSPNRIFLLLVLIPCAVTLLSGRLRRLYIADILIFAHTMWMCSALLRAHGFEQGIQAAGAHFVEVMGSYLVARCYIRTAGTFRAVVRVLFISIIIMLPFIVAETLTGHHYLNRFLALFGPTIIPHHMESRMGLQRAFGVFDHPILLGVYCVSIFSLTYYVLGYHSRRLMTYMRSGFAAVGACCSLSAGPLLALVVQSLFIGWDHITRRNRFRWQILASLIAAFYVLIDLISNRTPFHVIVSYLTFNTGNAYIRILIWNFGAAEVARHPWFGIGQNDWDRPDWMGGSMDNFWLVLAVQGGLPAFLFFAGAMVAACIAVGRLRLTDQRLISYRRGWIIAILGLAIAGGTVHYWKAIFCLLVFLIGSAVWMLDGASAAEASPAMKAMPRKRQVPGTIPLG